MTKHYPSELKERAVRLVLDAESEPGGRRDACSHVGAQLGVNADTLRGWVVQFEVNQGGRPGEQPAKKSRISSELRDFLLPQNVEVITLSLSKKRTATCAMLASAISRASIVGQRKDCIFCTTDLR